MCYQCLRFTIIFRSSVADIMGKCVFRIGQATTELLDFETLQIEERNHHCIHVNVGLVVT